MELIIGRNKSFLLFHVAQNDDESKIKFQIGSQYTCFEFLTSFYKIKLY